MNEKQNRATTGKDGEGQGQEAFKGGAEKAGGTTGGGEKASVAGVKSSQQLADEMAKKCAEKLIHESHIKRSILIECTVEDILYDIPLLELLEVARAAREARTNLSCGLASKAMEAYVTLDNALANLQKKVDL